MYQNSLVAGSTMHVGFKGQFSAIQNPTLLFMTEIAIVPSSIMSFPKKNSIVH